jgi:putative transposase
MDKVDVFRKSVHKVFKIKYHFVFCIKYRKNLFAKGEYVEFLISVCSRIEKRCLVVFETVGDGHGLNVVRKYIED